MADLWVEGLREAKESVEEGRPVVLHRPNSYRCCFVPISGLVAEMLGEEGEGREPAGFGAGTEPEKPGRLSSGELLVPVSGLDVAVLLGEEGVGREPAGSGAGTEPEKSGGLSGGGLFRRGLIGGDGNARWLALTELSYMDCLDGGSLDLNLIFLFFYLLVEIRVMVSPSLFCEVLCFSFVLRCNNGGGTTALRKWKFVVIIVVESMLWHWTVFWFRWNRFHAMVVWVPSFHSSGIYSLGKENLEPFEACSVELLCLCLAGRGTSRSC